MLVDAGDGAVARRHAGLAAAAAGGGEGGVREMEICQARLDPSST